jgi:hypothetical protein
VFAFSLAATAWGFVMGSWVVRRPPRDPRLEFRLSSSG